jgi:hypothetical protein
MRAGPARGDLAGDATGDQLAQHGVQAAGDLVAGPGQVTVPLGPDLEHGGVVVSGHLARGPGPQRGDRDRAGIVRVVLVHIAGLEQPHPRGQLGLDVQHLLARRGQLLGQHAAKPGGALDRPRAIRPRLRPRQQLPGLARAGADLLLAQRLLSRADHHRGARPLVRVDPDHHCHQRTPRSS